MKKKVVPDAQKRISPENRPFPLLGLKILGLMQFTEKCGGKARLAGLTTTEVCNRFVKEMTKSKQLSYCDQLQTSENTLDVSLVGKANVFISHAWKSYFNNVVDALLVYFKSSTEENFQGQAPVVWFDLFSNNQHGLDSPPSFEWWCGTFMNAIKNIGHVVVVLEPWENPCPFTRVWCLWEIYCAKKTKSKFEVAMSSNERQRFRQMLLNDPSSFNRMLSKVDVRNSESSNANDKQQIFQVISKTVGFENLNSLIFNCFREWMVTYLKTYILLLENKYSSKPDDITLKLNVYNYKHALATLYKDHGKYREAESLYLQCLEIRRKELGNKHPITLTNINNLALIYKLLGKFQLAEDLYYECLQFKKEIHGERHTSTLTSMNNLALVYRSQGKYQLAEALYKKCLQIKKEVLGDRHPRTLKGMNNLASVYDTMGKYHDAEIIYRECLQLKYVILGERHPDTLTTMNNLALVCYHQKNYNEAELLYRKCLIIRKELLGEAHPDTLQCYKSLRNLRLRKIGVASCCCVM